MPLGASKATLFGASAGGGGFSASGGTEATFTIGATDYKSHTFVSDTDPLEFEIS